MVILLRYALRGRIGLRLQYGLWLLVLVRLLPPVNFGTSPISAASGIEQIQRAGAGWVYRTSDAADTSNVTVSGWVRPSVQPAGVVSGPLPYFTSQPSNTPNGWNASTVWLVGMASMALWFLGTNLRFTRRLRRSRQLLRVADYPLPVYETAAVLEQLTSPGVLLALQRSEQGVFSLYDGSACPNWQIYTAQLASYRYEPAVMDVVSSAEVWLFPASETGTYRMRVCDDAEYVELMLEDGTVHQFQATNTDSELLVGDLVRMWFDEVEFYDRLANGATLYNQGQDEIAAAQAFCRILEKAHQSVADDSLYRYEFVRCVAEAAEEETKQLRKEGTLGETEWAVSVSTVFVPGNVDAREMALAAGAVPYEGGDPTIPTGAYETTRWVRITQAADGWRGELTGTSW